ncbi:MAG: PQQ-binding-like beta-propeller repeat protein [Verrucomicrobiales bacterium]|nr:PQQ-binding-like beta-propeller repeat protein [Verrucomicrobiales bacterium]
MTWSPIQTGRGAVLAALLVLGFEFEYGLSAEPGRVKWTAPCGATISSPSIGRDGTIYIGGLALFAFDPSNGAQKWNFSARHRIQSTPAIGPEGTVYFGSIDQSVYAIDGATGAKKWEFATDGQIESSAAITEDGTVLIGSFDGKIYALDAATGSKKWSFPLNGQINCSPVVSDDGTIYVAGRFGDFTALSPTGKRLWSLAIDSSEWLSPAIGFDGTLLLTTGQNVCVAIEPRTRSRRWAFGNGTLASPVLGPDATVYVGSADGKFFALDQYTGRMKWSFESYQQFWSTAAVAADHTVYVGGNDGYVYAFEGASGRVLWKHKTGEVVVSSPAIAADGTVYVASNDGLLYAFEGTAGPAISPWPKYRGNPLGNGRSLLEPTNGGPQILSGPMDVRVAESAPATMYVMATGGTPMGYQWLFEGNPIVGATNSAYYIPRVSLTNSGRYQVEITNLAGHTLSRAAELTSGYSLDVQIVGQGFVQVDPPQQLYLPGTKVTLRASPTNDHRFLKWNGDLTETTDEVSLVIDSNKKISAWFEFKPGEVRWRFETRSGTPTTPAIGPDGTVFLKIPLDDRIYALDPLTGQKRWEGSEVYQSASPAVTSDGNVSAIYALFDGRTGQRLPAYIPQDSVNSSPAVAPDGTIFFGSEEGKQITAVRGSTVRWRVATGGWVVSSPSLGPDGTVYVGSYDTQLRALSGQSGAEQWSFGTGGAIRSSPAVSDDGVVFIASDDSKLYALDGATGVKRWDIELEGYGTSPILSYSQISASPIVGPDHVVYLGTEAGYLYGIDGDTGVTKWRRGPGAPIAGSAALTADGTLYTASTSGILSALKASDGTTLWEVELGGSVQGSPNVGPDGTVYVSAGNVFYSIAGAAPLASTGWPTFRGNAANNGTGNFQFSGPPRIITTPQSVVAAESELVQFGVLASGALPLRYQWYVNGQEIPTATNQALSFTHASQDQAGNYHVSVTNLFGSVETAPATLRVGYRFEVFRRGQGEVQITYLANEPAAVLLALETAGRRFVRWSGDASGTTNRLFVPLNGNKSITAIFEMEPGELVWRADVGGAIRSSPALNASAVFVGADDGFVRGWDTQRGRLLWKTRIGGSVPVSPALTKDNRLIVSANGGTIGGRRIALDASTGSILWDYPLGLYVQLNASPAVDNDGFGYQGDGPGAAGAAFQRFSRSGVPADSYRIDASIESSAAISSAGLIVFGSDNGQVYCVKKSGLGLAWSFLTAGRVRSSPALGRDGAVYIGSDDGFIYAFDMKSGVLLWRFNAAGPVGSSPVIDAANTVYCGTDNGMLFALDGLTGKARWQFDARTTIRGAPAVAADGTIVVGTEEGTLFALDSSTGQVRWRFRGAGPITSSPSIGEDGTVYVGAGSTFYALAGSAPLADAAWPKFHNALSNDGLQRGFGGGQPRIVAQSDDLLAVEGSLGILRGVAEGGGDLRYQWYRDEKPIQGATAPIYVIPKVLRDNEGTYSLDVTNTEGLARSRRIAVVVGVSISIQTRGSGTVELSPGQSMYSPGSRVSVIAKPQEGRPFLGWGGDASGNANPLVLTLRSNMHLVATFASLPGDVVWQYDAQAAITATPAIRSNGLIYVTTRAGTVIALETRAGGLAWIKQVPGHIDSSPAIGTNGILYLVSNLDDGYVSHLYGFDATTGLRRFEDTIGISYPVSASPAIGPDGSIYVGTENGVSHLASFRPNAAFKWEFQAGASISSSAAVTASGSVIFGSRGGKLHSVSPVGKAEWDYSTGSISSSPAIGADGSIYFSDDFGGLHALDAAGHERWSITGFGIVSQSPVIGEDGTVYFVNTSGRTMAVNPDSGVQKWTWVSSSGTSFSPALAADGTLFIAQNDQSLVALDASIGQELFRHRSPTAFSGAPTIGPDGLVYVAASTKLLAIQGTAALAPSAWPKFRADLRNTGAAVSVEPLPPRIVRQPRSTRIAVGQEVRVGVIAAGSSLTYQWFRNGIPLAGETNSILLRFAAGEVDAGTYHVVVSNHLGSVNSDSLQVQIGYTLAVRSVGPGSVEITPAESVYSPRTVVSLRAVPASRRQFLGWEGDAAGLSTSLSLTMDRNREVAAVFSVRESEIKWSLERGGQAMNSPAVGPDDTVFVTTAGGHVFALEGRAGFSKWSVETGAAALTAPVLGPDSTLYMGSSGRLGGGEVICLDAQSGRTRWRQGGGTVWHPPAVTPEGTLFVVRSSESGITLSSLQALTGEENWSKPLNFVPELPPFVDSGGTIYLATSATFDAVRATDGAPLWSIPAEFLPSAVAMQADGTLFVGNNFRRFGGPFPQVGEPSLRSLNWAYGASPWRRDAFAVLFLVAAADGTLYGVRRDIETGRQSAFAMDSRTGELYWGGSSPAESDPPIHVTGVPLLGADATLYLGTDTGLLALDGFDGTTQWKADIGPVTTSPAMGSDGSIFVGVQDHTLYCIQGTGPIDPGPWVKHLGNPANSGVGTGVRRQPVLRAQRDESGLRLDCYGPIGESLIIERNDGVGNGVNWTPWLSITLQESPTAVLDLGTRSKSSRFYRARK